MKERVLDVLSYLFDHVIDEAPALPQDQEPLRAALLDAGFSPHGVGRAFAWLEGLAMPASAALLDVSATPPTRIFAEAEYARLDVECRGFLMFLEMHGILNAAQRELVLERILALDEDSIELEDLKWVVLIALSNRPGAEASYAWMAQHLSNNSGMTVH